MDGGTSFGTGRSRESALPQILDDAVAEYRAIRDDADDRRTGSSRSLERGHRGRHAEIKSKMGAQRKDFVPVA
jgi:hypothetical protein